MHEDKSYSIFSVHVLTVTNALENIVCYIAWGPLFILELYTKKQECCPPNQLLLLTALQIFMFLLRSVITKED